MLFTINKPILSSNSFESALRVAPDGSPFLLYEDGVFNAMPNTVTEAKVKDAMQNHTIFAIDTDLKARGIKKVIEGIEIITYDGFVGLVEEHDVAPWL
jgi:sulfur relay protein TusB/DsrH